MKNPVHSAANFRNAGGIRPSHFCIFIHFYALPLLVEGFADWFLCHFSGYRPFFHKKYVCEMELWKTCDNCG